MAKVPPLCTAEMVDNLALVTRPGEKMNNASKKFVARQPILDRSLKTIGYELLFRAGMENYFPNVDHDLAARSVIDESLITGIDVLCEGGWAFLNCTADVLQRQLITALPPRTTVVEILEHVEVTGELIMACHKLRGRRLSDRLGRLRTRGAALRSVALGRYRQT